jgi:hypothetical protein
MVKDMKERDIEFSGGKQGNGKQPRPKIQGTKHRNEQIKERNIPPPQPKNIRGR